MERSRRNGCSNEKGATIVGHPLILTLQIDEAAQLFYEDLRRRYFPSERNFIPAHLTLFHHLPDDVDTVERLREAVESNPGFRLAKPQLRFIGRGVAVFFQSDQLLGLHAALSLGFQEYLIPQDRQRFQPHIVLQNKVDPATARLTLTELQAHPFVEAQAIGLTLWRYLGGPWEHVMDLPFGDTESSSRSR